MNCQEFWDSLPQRGHEITQEQKGHLTQCSGCAAQWEPHRTLALGLHSMVEESRQVEAPERVEIGLTAAFRSQARLGVRRPAAHSWFAPVFAWASAAAAMIALAVVLVHGRMPARPDTVAAPQHHSVQSIPEDAIVTPESDSDDDSSMLDEGFVRLPNAPRLEPNEAYDFVTVAYPGSAMIALGLPVSEDRAGETVLAKVALGPDGTARAVRLVTEGETF